MAVSWTVTGQLDSQYSADGTGTPVLGHTILFITGNGDRGSVWVSNDHYNEKTVAAAIKAKAEVIDAVAKLHSAG